MYLSEDLSHISISNYLPNLVRNLVESYNKKEKLLFDLDEIKLNMETSLPCGLLVSKIVSNSPKYAFPDDREGNIQVILRPIDNYYELMICNDGIGLPDKIQLESTGTLGIKLIDNLITQIGGEYKIDRTNGKKYIIKFKELEYTERM